MLVEADRYWQSDLRPLSLVSPSRALILRPPQMHGQRSVLSLHKNCFHLAAIFPLSDTPCFKSHHAHTISHTTTIIVSRRLIYVFSCRQRVIGLAPADRYVSISWLCGHEGYIYSEPTVR